MLIVNFVNFVTMLVWAVVKLLTSMIMCCVTFCICWFFLLAIAEMVRKDANQRYNVWAEIEEMEREEYGD